MIRLEDECARMQDVKAELKDYLKGFGKSFGNYRVQFQCNFARAGAALLVN